MRRARSILLAPLLLVSGATGDFGPFTLTTDFEIPGQIRHFAFSDPAAWRIHEDAAGHSLELHAGSNYAPPHRSPRGIALMAQQRHGDFILEADLKQTGRDYGHRDMCIFFGFRDPAHYYYVHLATKTDDHAHNIFIVDGAARRKISTKTTDGVDWGTDAWHTVRVERSIADGTIKVYFDDLTEPIMTAEDKTFDWGHVGFGSFDDTGRVDNIRITPTDPRPGHWNPFGLTRDDVWQQAEKNAQRASDALVRCNRYVNGWLAHADPATGLIPRNLTRDRDVWNAPDAAADNYPFMVLTASITDRPLFDGTLRGMLATETKLTSRLGALPDDYSFSAGGFRHDEPDLGRMIFGGSEYMKDGLMPLTEWLGPSPWSERMISIMDDVWRHAPIETERGPIPSTNVEVNGELLQVLSRVYWMTGDAKYLDWAIRLGDHYLLDGHHPTRDFEKLRLRDHGCEIVAGLSELYFACVYAEHPRAEAYERRFFEMIDRVLEVGRNEHGMFYNVIDPVTGVAVDDRVADTWGYTYNAVYTAYLIRRDPRYRDAVRRVLANLHHYHSYAWEGDSADGYADSIESAINLLNREPVPVAAAWVDTEIEVMFAKQRDDGVIEGWHGDGNFARTAVTYALWKSQGVTIQPWRPDVRVGAVELDSTLYVSLECDEPWTGRVMFDRPRHRTDLHLLTDYPRINQLPEWFVAQSGLPYRVTVAPAEPETLQGDVLLDGLVMKIDPGRPVRISVTPAGAE